MQYHLMFRGMGWLLNSIMKGAVPEKEMRKKVAGEYRAIVERAQDIGAQNRLLSSYGLAAYFIALTRKTGMEPETASKYMEEGLRKSKLLKAFMGNAKSYFSEKNMASRREWSKQTHQHEYANDWVVDVLEKTPDYEFGFDYLECGVCKLCRDEGCPELAKYLCRLDFMLVEIIGIHLTRTETLAEGGKRCDFRFSALDDKK